MLDIRWVSEGQINAETIPAAFREIPLLDPGCERRRARWREVIRWYGRRTGLATLQPRAISPGAAAILAVGSEVEKIATFFAALEGRPLVLCSGFAEAVEQLLSYQSDNRALIFAPRAELTTENIGILNSGHNRQFNLVTGFDIAAIHFMAVKMALWARRNSSALTRTVVLLDELGGSICRRDADGTSQRADFEAHLVREVLDKEQDVLVMHVHGEGSHANLRDVVLCGVTFETEHGDDGDVEGGCQSGNVHDPRTCKRVHSSSVEIRGFEELRASEVALLSCNGFSVSGELYPSATSCLLSMVDGYASAIICNDRSVPLSSANVSLIQMVVAQGGGLADAADLLNAVATYQLSTAPWFVVGSPVHGREICADIGTNGDFVTKSGLVILRLPQSVSLRKLPVSVTDFPMDICSVLRGSDRIAFCFDGDGDDGPISGRIVVADSTLKAGEVVLVSALARCAQAAFLELGLDRIYGAYCRKEKELGAHFSQLQELRLLVERSLGLLSSEIARAREAGWVGKTLYLCIEHVKSAMSSWDRTLASLAAGYLATGSFEACLREGQFRVAVANSGVCSRCGSVLAVEVMQPASSFGPSRTWTTCSVCGPQACMEPEHLAIDVALPPRISPGAHLAIAVRLTDADPWLTGQPRFLALSFRDKGASQTICARCESFDGNEWSSVIDIPSDVSPDLHTLRVSVVHGMRIAHIRLRIASVPRPQNSKRPSQVGRSYE